MTDVQRSSGKRSDVRSRSAAPGQGKHKAHQPKILAITGGKGGVGKTSIALNLALTMAREGEKVLLLDGDTDLANVTIMLGHYPERSLAQVVEGQCGLEDVIMEAPFGLHIIPGASGVQRCIELGPDASMQLLRALAGVEKRYDYILIDTAAGLQALTLHMIASAGLACVVVTPDPTALTDAFSLLKVLHGKGYTREPSVLVNMARGASQASSVYQRFAGACQRHLGVHPHYMGAIWRDETLQQSVISQRPVALMPASDPSCRQFHKLADMVRVRFGQVPPRLTGIAAYWHQLTKKSADRVGAGKSNVAAADPAARCQQLIAGLEELLSSAHADSMLRYEAFNRLFALLGRTMGDESVEVVQTGLAALAWESLSPEGQKRVVDHLRDLAVQIESMTRDAGSDRAASEPAPERQEPRYDRGNFGDQESLVRALRAQPADISLDQLLRSLTGNNDSSD